MARVHPLFRLYPLHSVQHASCDAAGWRGIIPSRGSPFVTLRASLGSASLTTDASGNKLAELRYKPYGETRYTWGNTPTDYRFTGQRSEEAGLGSLYDYGARMFSPVLGRFLSADSIVPSPGNPQSLNRYSYVLGNPPRYTDGSGHCAEEDKQCVGKLRDVENRFDVEVDDANGLWTLTGLGAIQGGMQALQDKMGQKSFAKLFKGVKFSVYTSNNAKDENRNRLFTWGHRDINVGDKVLNDQDYVTRYTVHELGHVWDTSCGDCMSKGIAKRTDSQQNETIEIGFLYIRKRISYTPRGGVPPTRYAETNMREDWAESLTVVVFPQHASNQPWSLERHAYVTEALAAPRRPR